MGHPFRNVAIVGIHNTQQALRLDNHSTTSLNFEAARGLLDALEVDASCIDGVVGHAAGNTTYGFGIGPAFVDEVNGSLRSLVKAASLVATGVCTTVLLTAGRAGVYTDRSATAPWTRPVNEFLSPFGMYTAVEFALVARRHMAVYGTTPDQLAAVAATIRNNGHINPDAVFYGRGPYTAEDVLRSRMIADPFHVLDCAMTGEGGCGVLLTTAGRASDYTDKPVYLLGAASDALGAPYRNLPSWDLAPRTGEVNGRIGARAARHAMAMSGLSPDDIDCAELYDPFSFEVIRQLEAFGFCGAGEGGPFVEAGNIGPTGAIPVTTDGGTLSYSHGGAQLLQRAARGFEQITGTCKTGQVEGAEVVLCTNGGAGAQFSDVVILGSERP